MREGLSNTYAAQLRNMDQYLVENTTWPSPDTGYALFVFHSAERTTPANLRDILALPIQITRLNEAPVLSASGYGMLLNKTYINTLGKDWVEGFTRLSARDPFPTDRQSFFYRPTELLGLVLGATHCPSTTNNLLYWMDNVFERGEVKFHNSNPWSFLLTSYAGSRLGRPWKARQLRLDELTTEDIALVLWLTFTDEPFAESMGLLDYQQEAEQNLLEKCALELITPIDSARTAVIRFALDQAIRRTIQSEHERNWQIGRDSMDALALVRTICNRFDICVRQLQKRQRNRTPIQIKDEYDVQDFMHSLLRLHFGDVRAEEWTPSYAGNASRIDFLLKNEHIVVEVKMTRHGLDQKEVANQLINDIARYKVHPKCKTLVCFVYDPEHRCSNPVALESDLSDSANSPKVVTIVAPKGI